MDDTTDHISNDMMDEITNSIHNHQENMIKSWKRNKEYDIGIVEDLYPPLRKETQNNHQGEGVSGWHNISPKTKTERDKVKDKCGDKCFLMPEEDKFPVCDKKCNIDCRGIHSAYIRAKQHGYTKVANDAQNLLHKYNC